MPSRAAIQGINEVEFSSGYIFLSVLYNHAFVALAGRLTEQVIRDAGRTVAGDMLYAVGHASREEELQRMVAELIILAVERDKTGSG